MKNKNITLHNEKSPLFFWHFLPEILLTLYIVTMIILFFLDYKVVFEPPLLLPIMNTIFAGLIPITVAIMQPGLIFTTDLTPFFSWAAGC